jgi:spectrin beta
LTNRFQIFQFRRDVDDEKLWIAEKIPLALNTDYGNSLFNVHMLKKKNQVMIANRYWKSRHSDD